jgi:hypothetical protein
MGQCASSPDDGLPYAAHIKELLVEQLQVSTETATTVLDEHATILDDYSRHGQFRRPDWRTLLETHEIALYQPTLEYWREHIERISRNVTAELTQEDVKHALETYCRFILSKHSDTAHWVADDNSLASRRLIAVPNTPPDIEGSDLTVNQFLVKYPLEATPSVIGARASATVSTPSPAIGRDTRPLTVHCGYSFRNSPPAEPAWEGLTISKKIIASKPEHQLRHTSTTCDSREITANHSAAARPLTSWIAAHFTSVLSKAPDVLEESHPICDDCGPVNIEPGLVVDRPTSSHEPIPESDRLCPACYSTHLITETVLTDKESTIYAYHHCGLSPEQIADKTSVDRNQVISTLDRIEQQRETSARTTRLVETTQPYPNDD